AVEACNWAAKMKPDDMDLQKELKDLGAQQTMAAGKYATGKSFRDSMRDRDKQDALLDKDKDIRSADAMARQIAEAKREYEDELKEYTLWSDSYPTETGFKYQMAARLFELKRFDEAIPLFQQVRQDPKYRTDAAIALGKAFLEAGFADEAVDTLRDANEAYQ